MAAEQVADDGTSSCGSSTSSSSTDEAPYDPFAQDTSDDRIEKKRHLACGLKVLWAIFVSFTVACVVIGVKFGTCNRGTPDALFYAIAVVVSTAIVLQLYLLKCGGTGKWTRAAFVFSTCMGAAELLEFFTDGQQIAQAVLCDAAYHQNLVKSLSSMPFVARLVGSTHLYGLMAMAVLASLATQLATLGLTESKHAPPLVSAYLGLGGLQTVLLARDERWRKAVGTLRAVTVGAFEALPSLCLQAWLFGLTSEETGKAAQVKQALSMGLSAVGVVKLVSFTCFVARVFRDYPLWRCDGLLCCEF
mmetsp:Transcript_46363/g.107074  ORF Transcript_46363/g.107074 Transcript_46363/m.107074 type:complete len:304 (-) Transcript_46363:79-990(-)